MSHVEPLHPIPHYTRPRPAVHHEPRAEGLGRAGEASQKPDILLPDCNQAVDVGVVQPRALNSYYKSKIDAYGKCTLPIIIGTNGVLHEKSKKHLQDFGVDIPRFMAYAVFVIEYQHHKATADYMTKINSCLKGKIAVATDGRALR